MQSRKEIWVHLKRIRGARAAGVWAPSGLLLKSTSLLMIWLSDLVFYSSLQHQLRRDAFNHSWVVQYTFHCTYNPPCLLISKALAQHVIESVNKCGSPTGQKAILLILPHILNCFRSAEFYCLIIESSSTLINAKGKHRNSYSS